MGYCIVAFLWAGLEASIFFIVPDVWLTLVVVNKNLKTSLKALFYALAGALLGGLCVYAAAVSFPEATYNILNSIPGISEDLFIDVKKDVCVFGMLSFFPGLIKGIPYKIYAFQSGMLGKNPFSFISLTSVVRATRFLATIFIAQGFKSILNKYFKSKTINIIVFFVVWVSFYIFYFIHFGW